MGKRDGYRLLGQLPGLQHALESHGHAPRSDAGLEKCSLYADGADAESAELAALQLPEAPRPDAGPELADCRSRRGYDPVLPAEEKPRSLREIPRRSHQPRGNRGHESFPGSAGAGKRAGGFKRPDPRQLERVKSGHHF